MLTYARLTGHITVHVMRPGEPERSYCGLPFETTNGTWEPCELPGPESDAPCRECGRRRYWELKRQSQGGQP